MEVFESLDLRGPQSQSPQFFEVALAGQRLFEPGGDSTKTRGQEGYDGAAGLGDVALLEVPSWPPRGDSCQAV